MSKSDYYFKAINLHRTFSYTLNLFLNQKDCDLLKRNKELANIHRGETCYILGNGPSLNNIDLEFLKDECVFSVNQAFRNVNIKSINPKYHFWADPYFFKLDQTKKEDQEVLEIMKDNQNLISFYPIIAKDFLEKNSIIKNKNNLFFFDPQLCLYNNYNKKIDFTRPIPVFHTVVQYAICMAIYMGFKDIYILGCESTSIMTVIKSKLDKELDSDYSYNVTENERKRIKLKAESTGIEADLYSAYNLFKGYRILNEYCKKEQVNLIDLSTNGLIDSIKKESIEAVIANLSN